MLFTRCFDVLQLLHCLRGFLYERTTPDAGPARRIGSLERDGPIFDFHIFVFVIARNVRPAAFLPHGIPVAAPTCGRRVRGGEPDEDVKDAAKTRMKDTPQKPGVP